MSKASDLARSRLRAKAHKALKASGRSAHYGEAVAASAWSADDLAQLAQAIDTLRSNERRTVTVSHVCAACGEQAELEVEVKLDDLSNAAAGLERIQGEIGTGASRWFVKGG